MKKYILFLLTILVVLGAALVSNVMIANDNINKTFNNSGYVLKNSDNSERYYFDQKSKYKNSYNNQIVFNDTEGEKVVIDKNNFMHYSDGSISSFTKGVLLDLDTIESEPITYYNISANKILKKLSNNKYVTKNLDKELQFINLMWRISETKYLISGSPIKILFADGTEKEIDGFLELEYSDNEIVKIFNQEVTYKTISTDVYLQVGENIKVNLGTKVISKNDVNELTLENMVIDSNDNVTIIDMDEYKEEEKKDANEVNNTTTSNGTSGAQGGSAESSSNGDSTANGGTVTEENSTSTENNANNENSDVQTEIQEDVSTYAPKFTIKEFNVMSTRLKCKVAIEDEEERLVHDTTILILDNSTGKEVEGATQVEPLGKYDIEIDTPPILSPDKEYTLVMKSTYKIGETDYEKNFIYKIFRTPILGLTLSKDYFTENSLAFNINFESDSEITDIRVSIENPLQNETIQQPISVKNEFGKQKKIEFSGLLSNKEYIIKIDKISLKTAAAQSKSYEYIYKTLKEKFKFNNGSECTELAVQKNEKESSFVLSIPNINIQNSGIESLNYEIYTIDEDNGKETIIDNRITSSKEITLQVDGNIIQRKVKYFARVYATLYDNEKTVEYKVAYTQNSFCMDTEQYPTIRFEENLENGKPWERITGKIKIDYNNSVLNTDKDISVQCISNYENVGTIKGKYDDTLGFAVEFYNLRANTTYRLVVSGTLSLTKGQYDGNYEKDEYYDIIGTVIVNTGVPGKLKAIWNDSNDINEQKIKPPISLQLSNSVGGNTPTGTDDIVADTLTKIKIYLFPCEKENIINTTPVEVYEYIDADRNL